MRALRSRPSRRSSYDQAIMLPHLYLFGPQGELRGPNIYESFDAYPLEPING